jgi:hypothetical protein
LIFLVLLIFKLYWDKRAKNKGRIINHPLSAAIDGLIYIISAWFLFGWDAGGWIVLAIALRWILFDILFNVINDWEWNHYGSSSRLDRWLTRLDVWHLAPKVILLIFGIVIIIFT